MEKNNALSIFKTNEDIYGTDVSLMSDFFKTYIKQLMLTLKEDHHLVTTSNLPVHDTHIIHEVICKATAITTDDGITLVPDFDSLPVNIQSKLEKGIYKIAESKQVDNNFRAVIVDENNRRVKDITLKAVKNNKKSKQLEEQIIHQQQMKQIYQKLIEIQEFQTYQNDRDRDGKIIVPFLDARNKILLAEKKDSSDEVIQLLRQADDKLETAIHHVYTDIETTAKHLAKCAENPLNFMKNNFIRWLVSDLQIASKYIGVRMQILDYLEDEHYKKIVFQQYQQVMYHFITKKITKNGMTAVDLLQDYYPYSKHDDKNYWYHFKKKMEPILKDNLKELCHHSKSEVYFITVEDIDEKEK